MVLIALSLWSGAGSCLPHSSPRAADAGLQAAGVATHAGTRSIGSRSPGGTTSPHSTPSLLRVREFHEQVEVLHPVGASDVLDIVIYRSFPSPAASQDIIVYAQGFGQLDFSNCQPGLPGTHPDQLVHTDAMRDFARQGYVVAQFQYRHRGLDAPNPASGLPVADRAWRQRDHYVRDANALITVAQHVRAKPYTTDRVAFLGTSHGTWVVYTAVSDHPGLLDRSGLDIRTVIGAGEFANHLADMDMVLGFTEPYRRIRKPLGATFGYAVYLEDLDPWANDFHELRRGDLRSHPGLSQALYRFSASGDDRLIRLLEAAWFTEGCTLNDVSAICWPQCLHSVLTDLCLQLGAGCNAGDPYDLDNWFSQEVLDTIQFWENNRGPGGSLDPKDQGWPSDHLAMVLRNLSPSYIGSSPASGPLTQRAMFLIAEGDHNFEQNGRGFNKTDALDILRNRLAGTPGYAIPTVNALLVPNSDHCVHLDYLRLPECGLDLIRDELAQAFATP